jgi:hypothetical protein
MCSASVLSALYLSPYCEGISHFFILVVSAVAAAGTLVVCMHVRVAYFALGLLAALFFVQAFGLQVGLFFLLQHLYFRVLCSAGACASGGLGGDAANRALFRYQRVSEVAWVGLLVVYSVYLLSPAEEQMLCLQVWRWREFARAPPSGYSSDLHNFIDDCHSVAEHTLSEDVVVDTRVGRGDYGLYHEPLEQVLLYLGLSMEKNQTVNASIDGKSGVKRALMPGHPTNANLWFELYQRTHCSSCTPNRQI